MSEQTTKKFPTIKRSLTPKPRVEPSGADTARITPKPSSSSTADPAPPPASTVAPKRQDRHVERRSRSISFLLPDDLRTAFKARAKEDDQSLPNVLLDAIEATHSNLDDELRAEQPLFESAGLFQRPQQREASAHQSLMVISIPAQAVHTIDTLWQASEADNRSQFIRAALRKYLTG